MSHLNLYRIPTTSGTDVFYWATGPTDAIATASSYGVDVAPVPGALPTENPGDLAARVGDTDPTFEWGPVIKQHSIPTTVGGSFGVVEFLRDDSGLSNPTAGPSRHGRRQFHVDGLTYATLEEAILYGIARWAGPGEVNESRWMATAAARVLDLNERNPK